MTKTFFFAESCPYGVNTLSDADQLFRFDSAADRDAWVADDDGGVNPTRRELGPDDSQRIWSMNAHASAIVRDGVMVPPEFAPDMPAKFEIGA